ncbi:MAG: hypothetical protein NTV94_14765 [Planctomycetota bacterium]|nr:hypothetical protein [Planctomycetota bacterium]
MADPPPGSAPMSLVAPQDAIRIFGKTMHLDSPELDAFRISAPRILCRAGQPASIMIGRELEYLESAGGAGGEKLFRVISGPDLFEGLRVEVTASGMQGPINVDRLTVRLSECVERQPLDGTDLPVGKPVMRTREVSTQFTIEPGQRGLIPIKADGQQEKPEHLLVVVRLERVASQPAAAPTK